jgi:predicted HTH transcriptional regulator
MTNTSLIIADLFHLVGLTEERGRGNNRVIEMCRKATKAWLKPPVRPA